MKSTVVRIDPAGKIASLVILLLSLAVGACAPMSASQSLSSKEASLSQERIAEIVASPDRTAADRSNDDRRKPQQLLAFIGVAPGMVGVDLSAGGGYTTELLARAVGPHGHVYGQSAPRAVNSHSPPLPAGRLTSAQALAERGKNPVVSNMSAVVRRFEDPIPPELANEGLDLVTIMFNYHDLGHLGVDRTRMNSAVFAALKPGGWYVIADHSGRPGTGISESATLHRIEEAFLSHEVEAAGFKRVDQGSFLRNPSDPRDRNLPEPSQPKDGFVLKFIKP